MKVFVTKYALTHGIEEMEVEDCGNGLVKTPGSFSDGGGLYFHTEGRDWHKTLDAAKVRAEDMRHTKLVGLRKAVTKLEKMRF